MRVHSAFSSLKMQSPLGLVSSDDGQVVLDHYASSLWKVTWPIKECRLLTLLIDGCGLTAHMLTWLTIIVIVSQYAADDPRSNSTVCGHRAEPLQSKQHSRPGDPTNPTATRMFSDISLSYNIS